MSFVKAAYDKGSRPRASPSDALLLRDDHVAPAALSCRDAAAHACLATVYCAGGSDGTRITRVINYELPHGPEAYVHRIGRTARAGKSGIAVSFCDGAERAHLKSIERLTKRPLTIVDTTELLGEQIVVPAGEPVAPKRSGRGGGPRNGGGGNRNQPGKQRRFGGKPGGGGKPNAGNRGQRNAKKSGQPQSRRQLAGA